MSKTLFVLITLIGGLSSAVYGQEPQKDAEQNLGNVKYLYFRDFASKDLESLDLNMADDETGQKIKPYLSWLKKREDRWIQAFEKAVILLPESFFERIGETSWMFLINQDDWGTAYAGAGGGVVNLLPSLERPDWMTWEPFPVNGYSQEEMMFTALHELGHVYDEKVRGVEKMRGVSVTFEGESTLYGHTMGPAEDFAETFALYVLWPEYLKDNFPRHYGLVKTILAREYKSVYSMPESVTSRLTVKGHVANSH